ncbi:MAG: hypothetical protein JWR83_3622 [Aeromicrobium sp.]|nr:hypothetical protein [Aeromicrobium sp.]
MSAASSEHRPRRRRRRGAKLTAGVVALAIVGGSTAFGLGLFSTSGGKASADSGLPPKTTKVAKQTLLDTTTGGGELGYGSSTKASCKTAGTITDLPSVGTEISRGEALYAVNDIPVTLMYGATPAYRTLEKGVEGPDVEQLEANLAALGYVGFTVDEDFTAATAAAVKRWQDNNGREKTGRFDFGTVVFTSGAVRIDSLTGEKGAAAAPGQDVLSYTGTKKAVTLQLDIDEQSTAKKGAKVTVTLPNDKTVTGKVSSVSLSVTPANGDQAAETKVDVVVAIPGKKAQKAVAPFALASVNVTFTASERKNVLTVPVAALLALQEGGFGLEVVKGKTSTYVPVETGLFSDGKVEVTGDGIAKGTVVGMPK